MKEEKRPLQPRTLSIPFYRTDAGRNLSIGTPPERTLLISESVCPPADFITVMPGGDTTGQDTLIAAAEAGPTLREGASYLIYTGSGAVAGRVESRDGSQIKLTPCAKTGSVIINNDDITSIYAIKAVFAGQDAGL